MSQKILGGSYNSVSQANHGSGKESHHLIAKSSAKGLLTKGEGAVISMNKLDHTKTASWGSSKGAKIFQKQQKQLLQNGNPEQAFKLGIDDVKAKFGNKYNAHLQQAQQYWKSQNLTAKIKSQVAQAKPQTTSQKLEAIKKTAPQTPQTNSPLNNKVAHLKSSAKICSQPKINPNLTPKNYPKPS